MCKTSNLKSDAAAGYFAWDEANAGECLQKAVSFYHENGYAVLRGQASTDEINALYKAGNAIIEDFYNAKEAQPASYFSTIEDKRRNGDCRFLNSASNITCFLEEAQEAQEAQGKGAVATKPVASRPAINKIGHALHDLHPVFETFSRSRSVRRIAHAFGIADAAVVVQSMYILKSARLGGVVTPHRDATFVTPASDQAADCLGFWWPLQRATPHNGCLYIVPRSHCDGVAPRRMRRTNNANGDEGDEGDDGALRFDGAEDCDAYGDAAYVGVPVEVGDLVLLHGAVVHKSSHNYSEESRHAYSIHVVHNGLADSCWLQREEHLPFRRL